MTATTTGRTTSGRLGPRAGLGMLGALTAAVLAGTALAGPVEPPTVLAAAFGARGPMAAAAPGAPNAATPAAAPATVPAARSDDDGHRVRVRHVRTRARVEVHRDDRSRHAVAWRLRTVRAPALDAENLAVATTRDCTDCHAVALSVQIVLAGRNEGRVVADNLAVGVTLDCVRCTSVALAYQFVVARPGRPTLTRQARRDLADLRRRMRDVARHGDPADLVAQEDALAAQILAVLRSGVVDRDRRDDAPGDDLRGGARSGGPSTSPGLRSRGSGDGDDAGVRVRRSHDTTHGRSDR